MNSGDEQAQWVAWIWGDADARPPKSLRPLSSVGPQDLARGLGAYREHAKALAVRALAARFPLLRSDLGEADFAGMAWAFARQHPPTQGDLNQWGDALPDFLDALPGMESRPPLLARIDDALHRLSQAEDDPEPDPGLWLRLQQQPASRLRLRWSANLRWMAVPGDLAEILDPGNQTLDRADGWLLLWRRHWQPCRAWLASDQAAWLRRQAHALSLADAVEAQAAEFPDFDLGSALARAWQQGWLLGAETLA